MAVPVSESISEGVTNFVWELGALGIVEDGLLRAFFPPGALPEALETAIRGYLDSLRALGYAVGDIAPTVTPLADGAWSEAWKRHFRPIAVGTRLLVAPPWDIPPPDARLSIVIEPGRAFGTGHHESTAGCLILLERAVAGARGPIARAIDLGTGSGILAIAAARLGVAEVLAVDSDPDAVAAAVANAARNAVQDRLRCAVADAATLRTPDAPLVVANLLTPAHSRLAAQYARLTRPRGALILGGILEREADEVRDTVSASGFVPLEGEILAGWASLMLTRS